MHRNNLLNLIAHYQQQYPEEQDCIARFLHFVKAHPTCFERSLAIGHVTGSAWVVNEAGTHTLLTHHRKLNRWLQLGGHADGQTDILAVALREAQEESGIQALRPISNQIFDLDIHLIPAKGNEAPHHHYDVRFMIQVDGSDQYVVSDESHALSWVSIAQLTDKTQEESMLRMQKKWQAQQASP